MPPPSASIGKVRIPPGRRPSLRAKKSSKASPRKKLRPRRSATWAGEGVVIMARLCSAPPGRSTGVGAGGSVQQGRQTGLLLLHLIEGALFRRFVGAPAQEPRAVAEAIAAEMIV